MLRSKGVEDYTSKNGSVGSAEQPDEEPPYTRHSAIRVSNGLRIFDAVNPG